MHTVIVTACTTATVCALLVLAFWLGVRQERRRQLAVAEWLLKQQREAVDAALQDVGAGMPKLPTRDEVEREFLKQTDAANLQPL